MTQLQLDPGFTTPAMADVFSASARVAAMCRVEAALAQGSADAGVVPRPVAEAIAQACAAPVEDPDGILRDGWEAGTPALPLLGVLRSRLSDEAVRWLHHGATTQDVVDTGVVLQARDALRVLDDALVAVARSLRTVAAEHRSTPTRAWTFLQPAEPTTVGLRVAGWLEPTVRHALAVRTAASALPVQLGGPTGTLAAFGAAADAVVDAVAARLQLAVPPSPWHTDRSRIAEVVGLVERIARTMGKVGTDLALLAHRGEVRMRAGGSSSMPGKRNPVDAVRAVAAAEVCSGAASIVVRGRPHELERGAGGWHAEWAAVPLTFSACAAAVDGIGMAAATLEVDVGVAAAHLDRRVDADAAPTAGPLVDRVVALCDELLGVAP